jgi:hypothetical protein
VAQRKRGTSSHTKYRHAREHLTSLESQYATLERSRPRTSGKHSWRTRRLNKLARQLRAARGQLTRTRNAIADAARTRAAAKSAAKQRRSDAAKRGWRKQSARNAPVPAQPARTMRFLEERNGEVKQVLVDPPSKADRSAIGSYWHAISVYRDTGSTALLSRFKSKSIYDALRRTRLPFVVNPALLLEAIAAGHTDFDDIYSESAAWASAA